MMAAQLSRSVVMSLANLKTVQYLRRSFTFHLASRKFCHPCFTEIKGPSVVPHNCHVCQSRAQINNNLTRKLSAGLGDIVQASECSAADDRGESGSVKKTHSTVKEKAGNIYGGGENHTWKEFSKDFSEDDVFGTLNPDVMNGNITKLERKLQNRNRKHLSAKFNRVSDSKTTKNVNGTEPDLNYSALGRDEEWTSEFGSLAGQIAEYKEIEIEEKTFEDDVGETDESENPPRRLAPRRRHTPNWYGKQIEALAEQGKIYECIQVLETQMLMEDYVKPNQYVFTVLIGALGRAGYTEKAFELFEKMKEFKLEPENPTYTGLFNACSNSSDKEDGLKRANWLREWMQDNGVFPNLIIYKAMIKAFGRCGDLQTAFSLVDELTDKRMRADEEVFAMLLQACLSNKDTGLRYAIQVWRRLHKRRNARPTIYHYNLLIRIVKECGIGDLVVANQILLERTPDQTLLSSGQEDKTLTATEGKSSHFTALPVIQSQKHSASFLEDVSQEHREARQVIPADREVFTKIVCEPKNSWWAKKSAEATSLVECDQMATESLPGESYGVSVLQLAVPDILSYRQDFSAVVGLGNLDTKENRLALFGGFPGMLAHMTRNHVEPDIRTVTQLLDMIPSTREAESDLVSSAQTHRLELDVSFFNMLIRRRNLRKDYIGAKDIIKVMGQKGLTPNIMTYGCLAMGCYNRKEGLQLIRDMENLNCVPSVDVCYILMTKSRMDFHYKLALVKTMGRLQILPNRKILEKLENDIHRAQSLIVRKEKGKDVPYYVQSEGFDEEFVTFLKFYKPWLLSTTLEREPDPWIKSNVNQ